MYVWWGKVHAPTMQMPVGSLWFCDFVIKINYLDTGLTPQKRTTIHTRSIKLKNIIIFYNTHPAMQPKAKMHMNIFQVLQHTYMQWFCYLCILHPWCIKIPKDAKKICGSCVLEDAKIDWSIWRCFWRIDPVCVISVAVLVAVI